MQTRSQSWGRKCDGHARLPQLASSSPNCHLTIFKWTQIWHRGASSHGKWWYHCAFPFLFEIFKIFMPKLKNRASFVKHAQESLNQTRGHMLVWCYITIGPQNTIWTNQKVSCHLHKPWSTLVWPDLPKVITNSKSFTKIPILHIWIPCVSSYPWKIIPFKK